MTRDEVIDKLTYEGFTVKRTEITDEYTVEHRGETVARVYDTYVCIAKYYPSINPDGASTSYEDADKFVITFSHPISEIDTAIQWVLESPDRIDTEKRRQRIDTVRRYFDDRRSRLFREAGQTSQTSPARPILSSYMGSSRLYPPRHSTLTDEVSTP